MATITTTESGAKKRTMFGRKKARKKSAGRRRNGAISSDVGKTTKNHAARTAVNDAFVLPRLEFEMALEITAPDEENWTGIVRDAAEATGGDLLFVLPWVEDSQTGDNGAPANAALIEHAMVRLVEAGESRLLLVRAGETGFHMVEEDAIEASLARFARASIDVLERLGSDKRVVAPLTTLARH